MSWWSTFFSYFSGPLDFLNWIIEQVYNELVQPIFDKITEPIHAFFNFLTSVPDRIADAFNHAFFYPLQNAFGPFWVIIAVFIAGAAVFVILWIVDQILNLL